jgi:hypothetical protein
VWVHVDVAFAGVAQHLTQHFAAFDSFDMNMSKWLLTNVDARSAYVGCYFDQIRYYHLVLTSDIAACLSSADKTSSILFR